MTKSTQNLLPTRFDNQKISEKNPWNDDKLERKKFADVLTNKVKNGLSPYTISINGSWGTGKTFLLQRWRQQLENEGYKAIYYNAWEDDFCVNPLVSIIGQIAMDIKDNDLINSIKEIAIPLLIKQSLNRINLTPEELQSEIGKTISNYSEQTAQIKKLKERLEKLTTTVEKDTEHSLIFIIDELDRCRPTFAIEILERIKHLFNIPGIIFVLGMNRTELEKSIKHVYGNINSEDYLRRFCDIDLTLSAPKSSNYYLHLANSKKHSLSALTQGKNYEADLFDYLNISLRDTEYCFRVLCFILNEEYSYEKKEGWVATCLIIILLRMTNSELYWRFIQGQSSCVEVINDILQLVPEGNNGMGTIDNIVIKGVYSLANDLEWDNIIREADRYQNKGVLQTRTNLATRSLPLIKRLGQYYFDQRHEGNALQKIASSLDLVDY